VIGDCGSAERVGAVCVWAFSGFLEIGRLTFVWVSTLGALFSERTGSGEGVYLRLNGVGLVAAGRAYDKRLSPVFVRSILSMYVDVVLDDVPVFGPHDYFSFTGSIVFEWGFCVGAVIEIEDPILAAFPLFHGLPVVYIETAKRPATAASMSYDSDHYVTGSCVF